MKKVLLIIVALVMVLSGVAAVSAYEAHIVNVSAHVENALSVGAPVVTEGGAWLGKTVFPEEWLTAKMSIGLSSSFSGQSPVRVDCVDYNLYAEGKASGEKWLGDAMFFIVDPPANWDLTTTGNMPIPTPTGTPLVAGPVFTPDKTICIGDTGIFVGVGLDVPVFDGYYNAATDVKPKPNGLNAPTLIIYSGDAYDRYYPVAGFDGGIDVKIQVRSIYKAVG